MSKREKSCYLGRDFDGMDTVIFPPEEYDRIYGRAVDPNDPVLHCPGFGLRTLSSCKAWIADRMSHMQKLHERGEFDQVSYMLNTSPLRMMVEVVRRAEEELAEKREKLKAA